MRSKFFTPGVSRAGETAAGCELPFGFDRQFFFRPRGVGACILVTDVNDGVVIATVDAAAGTLRMLPIRAWHVFPPRAVVAQIHGPARLSKDRRARHQERGVGV